MKLRSDAAYWENQTIPELIARMQKGETLLQGEYELLIQELDRRFMQLWDKRVHDESLRQA